MMVAALKEQLPEQMDRSFINHLYKHKWVVYAKRPFKGPQSVVEYMGRYTHKIAISNHRIKKYEAGRVTFSYKDYKQARIKKEISLEALEFIRRFTLHVLPKGFVRIRHYGICSSTAKEKSALIIKAQVPAWVKLQAVGNARPARVLYNPKQCPTCKKETMATVMHFRRRGPPAEWKQMVKDLLDCITPGEMQQAKS